MAVGFDQTVRPPVELGAKALDMLLVLVEAEGRLVSKGELLQRVWPGTVVNDTNVTAQISALRKALGNGRDLVKTDAGRGYRFTSAVRKVADAAAAIPKLPQARTLSEATSNLPMPLSSLVGREQDLDAVLHRVTTQRLLTLVGPGGIGKTQLALRAARQPGWQTTPAPELVATYAPEVDNIRVTLEWAFDGDGDAEIGVGPAAAAVPLWTLLSILGECRDLVDRALRQLAQGGKRQTRHEMLLQAALARSSMWAKGASSEAASANERALDLAERLGDAEYQLMALYNLWTYRLRTGELRTSLAIAERFRRFAEAKGDLAAGTGLRMEGASLFYLAEYARARIVLESVLDRQDADLRRSSVVRFGIDQRVSVLASLARLLWLQGFPDRARRMAEACVAEARRADHVNSLCIALCFGACGLATMSGEPGAAEEFVPILTEDATKHGLGMWQVDSMALKGWLAIKRGDIAAGLELLTAALAEFKLGRLGLHQPMFVDALAEALGTVGRAEDGLATIEDAIAEARRNEANWCLPELIRIRGELRLRRALAAAPLAAEKDFREALELAERHGARSWALRTATSLARLWQAQGRGADARKTLRPLYEGFTEGFDSADLKAAQALLAALR